MGLLKKFIEPVDMTEGSPWQKIVLFCSPDACGKYRAAALQHGG